MCKPFGFNTVSLDVAEVGGLAEGGEGIASGDEFVGDEAAETGGDAADDAVPLDFLGAVELVAAGNEPNGKKSKKKPRPPRPGRGKRQPRTGHPNLSPHFALGPRAKDTSARKS